MREIPDKKLHLFKIHEKSAETYDKNIEHRELSNKMNTYRRVLLSYAEGKVLEVGVGTGRCLKFYDPKQIDSYTGIDWSPAMLLQAFEKVEELKTKKEFPFKEETKFDLV